MVADYEPFCDPIHATSSSKRAAAIACPAPLCEMLSELPEKLAILDQRDDLWAHYKGVVVQFTTGCFKIFRQRKEMREHG
jgi:hypothetical protein